LLPHAIIVNKSGLKEGVMTIPEQIWFLIGIGGFLVYLEGAITSIARELSERLTKHISEGDLKMIVGFVILTLAIGCLKINLPQWVSYAGMGLLLLILAVGSLINLLRRKKRRSV
jgi:hypothetical protein